MKTTEIVRNLKEIRRNLNDTALEKIDELIADLTPPPVSRIPKSIRVSCFVRIVNRPLSSELGRFIKLLGGDYSRSYKQSGKIKFYGVRGLPARLTASNFTKHFPEVKKVAVKAPFPGHSLESLYIHTT